MIAQHDFGPVGAQWTYDYISNEEIGYQTLTVLGDTIIKDSNCRKIHWEQFYVLRQTNDSEEPLYRSKGFRYIHQKTDSIFYFDEVRDTFILLLDLGINGDESFSTIYSSLHPFFDTPFQQEGIIYSYYVLKEDSITILYNSINKKLKSVKIFAECNSTSLVFQPPKYPNKVIVKKL